MYIILKNNRSLYHSLEKSIPFFLRVVDNLKLFGKIAYDSEETSHKFQQPVSW